MNADFHYRYLEKFGRTYRPKGGRVFSPTLARGRMVRQRSHTFTSGGRVFLLVWDGSVRP